MTIRRDKDKEIEEVRKEEETKFRSSLFTSAKKTPTLNSKNDQVVRTKVFSEDEKFVYLTNTYAVKILYILSSGKVRKFTVSKIAKELKVHKSKISSLFVHIARWLIASEYVTVSYRSRRTEEMTYTLTPKFFEKVGSSSLKSIYTDFKVFRKMTKKSSKEKSFKKEVDLKTANRVVDEVFNKEKAIQLFRKFSPIKITISINIERGETK